MNKSIDTFEKVCTELGKDPQNYTVNPDWHVHEKYAMGIKRLLLIHKFHQGGKEVTFANKKNKWFPYFWPVYDDSGRLSGFRFDISYCTNAGASSILSPLLRFLDEETSSFVGRTFLEEFNNVLMLENEL